MPSANKTGLVYKISLVLFFLLATVVYKLNDYFKDEKLYSAEARVRNQVILVKTAVSSQLSQLRNTLSSYETGLDDSKINWVQLDPFFAIASVDNNSSPAKVNQLLVRSNTPAEHWNNIYLEKALAINKSKKTDAAVLAQLFLDKAGAKFLILRFDIGAKKELVVVGSADYFQKFFDIERGEKATALLVTTENTLVAHSEGDYIATQTKETKLSKKKYIFEKEEIVGTNLIAMNYVLKRKIAAALVVPWSIVGVVAGFGCILVAILFYSLDPIERKIERYKKQERAQVYKDTVGGLVSKASLVNLNNTVLPLPPKPIERTEPPAPPAPYLPPAPPAPYLPPAPPAPPKPPVQPVQPAPYLPPAPPKPPVQPVQPVQPAPYLPPAPPLAVIEKKQPDPKDFYSMDLAADQLSALDLAADQFLALDLATDQSSAVGLVTDQSSAVDSALDSDKIDLADIEKALALDDFDSEEMVDDIASWKILKENLTPQKISLDSAGGPIDQPRFALHKKDYKVDSFKVYVRRPEKQSEKQ